VKHYRTEKIENARKSDEGERPLDPAEEDNWEPTENDEWQPDSEDMIDYKSYLEKTVVKLCNIIG
jgi:hypothetical protein